MSNTAPLASLLAETQAEPPCGPNLGYDPAFVALETSIQTADDTSKWAKVEEDAQKLLARSKDLRLAVWLCRAWLKQQGLMGLAKGLQLIAQLLAHYWVAVHPQAEDEDDHLMRMNTLAALNEKSGLLKELRDTVFLVTTQLGPVSVRDVQTATNGQTLSGDRVWSIDELRLAVQEEQLSNQASLAAVKNAHTALADIQKTCAEKLPAQQDPPSLKELQQLLNMLHGLLPGTATSTHTSHTEAETDAHSPSSTAPRLDGPPTTREQATAQLRHIAQVLDRCEPTNPAQLLIERAVRLMHMRFMDIVQELELTHINQFENITGLKCEPTPADPAAADATKVKLVKPKPSHKPLSASGTYNRDELLAQLLHIATFLEQAEPTNPASLLVRRAAKLMRMSFIELVRELSPESVSQVEVITGNPSGASPVDVPPPQVS